ncbi:conserved mitochondrial protein [Sporothrix schenckii 1099-18]|uniref:Dol-P-Man:Man(5)GlcNAc(2)-PP-Dol alpha-1,3-mannosyltransferase n=2 Tax=Sporothrix schenckii TaxID=29908 RepID=U7Q2D8_SPOS1|nr:conserved mitochondrial protein [Sporothrix schenckii 1099-18]ERT01175.1 hypothetical protein HMPREF1624_02417 [Sporothrix schenckii ATCC 58251]KJR88316.1 conserved mitochondrial protein [Sporothrix schenckii 1099-18]
MSKLSASLKTLINAPFSRPGPTAAPPRIADVYRAIARDAAKNNIGSQPWVTFSAAATITLNAPDALAVLWRVASEQPTPALPPVAAAELIREVGLKCIGFNGIPRTINVLGSFRNSGLPADVVSQLATTPTRVPRAEDLPETTARGLGLWRSVYAGVDVKLLDKLAESHPDLPVHILNSHYGPLFTDPPNHGASGLATVGRALTSLVAIACLRAQTGVGPQVVSHIFGLRKAVADGTWLPHGEQGASADDKESVRGVDWLATDAGSEWLLQSIDRIVGALGGSNFAGGSEGSDAIKAKL